MKLWAACIGFRRDVLVGQVEITETEKQYQIVDNNGKIAMAYHYAKTVNKATNKLLFETKKEALQALVARKHIEMVSAAKLAEQAFKNWVLVAREMERE